MQLNPLYFIPVVLIIVFVSADQIARRRSFTKAAKLFESGQYEELISYLDGKYARFFYPKYNRAYMQFRTYDAMGDVKRASETIDLLFALNPADNQLPDLLIKAFEFYLRNGDKTNAKKMLDRIDTKDEFAKMAPELKKLYLVLAEGNTSYIDEMKAQLDTADDPTKQRLLYLLSKQYETLGDEENAAKYREMVAGL